MALVLVLVLLHHWPIPSRRSSRRPDQFLSTMRRPSSSRTYIAGRLIESPPLLLHRCSSLGLTDRGDRSIHPSKTDRPTHCSSSLEMATTPKSLKDLSGKWSMNRNDSTDVDAVLKIQGFNIMMRKAISVAPVNLSIRQPSADEIHIDQSTVSTHFH